jgi:hypothetical protein
VAPATPPRDGCNFAPRYSTLEVDGVEKGYAKDSSSSVTHIRSAEEPRKRWSSKKFIIIIVIAVVVVIGAVLGGKLGSVLGNHSGGGKGPE